VLSTFTVTNTADSGLGSLRQAILDANAATSVDTIAFNIPGSGVHTIAPKSALPTITDSVTIDGRTQPGFAGKPLIELDGENAGPFADGLDVAAGNSVVEGLAINRFGGFGVVLGVISATPPTGDSVVRANLIGTDPLGVFAEGNGGGVEIADTQGNLIGGEDLGATNLISGNQGVGILVVGNAANGSTAAAMPNLIRANLIGTDATAMHAIGNSGDGVVVSGASATTIGGTNLTDGNIIAGNGGNGIVLTAGADSTIIQGNAIGTDLGTGTLDLGNTLNGILINSATHTTIGGSALGAANVIRFNGALAIFPTPSPDVVQNNILTPNRNQVVDLKVSIVPTADRTTVGGHLGYNIAVTNQGPAAAAGVRLTVGLPSGLSVAQTFATQGVVLSTGSGVQVAFGALAPGATAHLLVATTANQATVGAVTAAVTNDRFEINPADNQAATTAIVATAPHIIGVFPTPLHGSVVALNLLFDTPINILQANDTRNYVLSTAGPDGRFGTGDDVFVPIKSASLNQATRLVTILLARPVPLGTLLRAVVAGPGSPGFQDVNGNQLDGDNDGQPGGAYTTIVGLGSLLRYIDADGDLVTLGLVGPGLMQVILNPSGDAQAFGVIGGVAGQSALIGTVVRTRFGGDGRTSLGQLFGLQNVRSFLKNPPFSP
jgi:uncharacterized repeat protein (TIGR01451 family)